MNLLSEIAGFAGKLFTGIFISLIKIYKYTVSPLLPAGCRFYPSCSSYSLEAFKMHGPLKGFLLSAVRILRCNPWGGSGIDTVPSEFTFFK